MAFDPNGNQEHDETFSGTFFADMGAFGDYGNDNDEWNDEHEDDDDESGGHYKAPEQENEFRSVADQALQALDEEYSMALRGVVLPPTATENDATDTYKRIKNQRLHSSPCHKQATQAMLQTHIYFNRTNLQKKLLRSTRRQFEKQSTISS